MSTKTKSEGFADVRLDTWKSIAQHLGRSTRTVQRWRSEYGLPVRQLGGDASSVFAYTDELDEWLRGRRVAEEQADSHREEPSDFDSSPRAESRIAQQRTTAIDPATPGQRRAAELIEVAEQMWKSLCDANVCSIVRLYREASDLDACNARAFAGLAQALIASGVLGLVHPSDAYGAAQAALRRALELEPDLIETRCADAWVKMLLTHETHDAAIRFDEVLTNRPECTQALVGRALVSIAWGESAYASELLRRASTACPLNSTAISFLCWQEYLAGNFETALAFVSQARSSGHAGALLDTVEALARVLLNEPLLDIERLSASLHTSPRNYTQFGVLGYMYGLRGEPEKAQRVIDSMTVPGLRGKHDYAYAMALTFLGLNQLGAAMEWLEQSFLQGSLWSLGFQQDPILALLRQDPQAGRMFARMQCVAQPTTRQSALV